jgi:3-methyladenine DNA glycosylase AlkD
MIKEYIAKLTNSLDLIKDSHRAIAMKQYMRNQYEFLGVTSVPRKELFSTWKKELPINISKEERWELIYELWEKEEREYHYIAMDWLNSWKIADIEENDDKHLKFLISNKSWWDTVDLLSSNVLGKYGQKFQKKTLDVIEEWSEEDSFWLHRATIIFQLRYKRNTDLKILTNQIIRFQSNKEFFIQKAIGWSLREYAKTDANWVINFVEENGISGLAKREALKQQFRD